jgi:hypothetical protein
MKLTTTDEIIGALERGDLAKECAAKHEEVLQALVDQGGNASLTVKLKFSAKAGSVTIKASVETTLSKKERRSSFFFLTDDGRLSLQHPDQPPLPFDRRCDAIEA